MTLFFQIGLSLYQSTVNQKDKQTIEKVLFEAYHNSEKMRAILAGDISLVKKEGIPLPEYLQKQEMGKFASRKTADIFSNMGVVEEQAGMLESMKTKMNFFLLMTQNKTGIDTVKIREKCKKSYEKAENIVAKGQLSRELELATLYLQLKKYGGIILPYGYEEVDDFERERLKRATIIAENFDKPRQEKPLKKEKTICL